MTVYGGANVGPEQSAIFRVYCPAGARLLSGAGTNQWDFLFYAFPTSEWDAAAGVSYDFLFVQAFNRSRTSTIYASAYATCSY